ncbi:NAD(P)H-binding protein [Fragilaria crotonensis]|nr:NAD(P)H-binding protein [Fragilaria crotonensis]
MVKSILLILLLAEQCYSFGDFQLPKMPWEGTSSVAGSKNIDKNALQTGDTVAVVGASGNVGKLVALRLSDSYNVNGITRDASSLKSFFDGRSNIKLFEVDLLDEMKGPGVSSNLLSALEGANAIVICTGTTAFPTKAWSRTGEEGIAGNVLSALVASKFSVADAIEALDDQGFNTPFNIDAKANEYIVKTWQKVAKVPKKRAIMLSSIGVKRRDSMPFPILNACGVLDAKAAGEDAVQQCANESGYSYTIIRPGQLFGGPYDNNYYLGTLFQLDKDAATQDIQLGRGDELLGDTLRSTLAEITAQVCETDSARNTDFACINVKGEPPSLETIRMRLEEL